MRLTREEPALTRVDDYIDASRCNVGAGAPCTAVNRDATTGSVFLQVVNQDARLTGVDVSGYLPLARTDDYGSFTATGVVNYVNGKNLTTGDHLYNIMPLNAKLSIVQRLNGWTDSIEAQFVDANTCVSQVRNEVKSAGYGLLNLRSDKEWKQATGCWH